MGIETRLCKDLGMKVPLLLSGMGPFSTYKTAVKVSNAGGCGLTSHWGLLSPVDPETHYIDRENGVMITPGEKMKFDNISLLEEKDQLKFVIKNKKDYNYAKKIIEKYKPNCPVYFQPVWETDPEILADWIKKDRLKVTLGLQLHKLIWGDERKR